MNDIDVLEHILKKSLFNSDDVFEDFLSLENAAVFGFGKKRFVYIPGHRSDRVVLIAHADSHWDLAYQRNPEYETGLICEKGCFRSASREIGIGADDRAGCAILWLLKDLGHSLLITDGEENRLEGSSWLMTDPENKHIAQELNEDHQFMVQFDRMNGSDYKCYSVGTDEFRRYIEEQTGFTEPDRKWATDIVRLCRSITGVNLSIGYRNEHTPDETLVIDEWKRTLDIARNWLMQDDLPRFPLSGIRHEITKDFTKP